MVAGKRPNGRFYRARLTVINVAKRPELHCECRSVGRSCHSTFSIDPPPMRILTSLPQKSIRSVQ